MRSIAEWADWASVLSSPMKLTSSASFSPSIRISLRLRIHQAQAKNFCRVLDIRVAQIVKADAPQMIIPQDDLERIGEIIRLEQIAHCVYADVVCVFFVVAPTAQLAVFFLFLLQGKQPFPENRHKRQGALAGFCFCVIGFYKHFFSV